MEVMRKDENPARLERGFAGSHYAREQGGHYDFTW